MRSAPATLGVLLLSLVWTVSGLAQEGGIKPSVFTGEVISVGDHGISIKTKDAELSVEFSEKTSFRKVPPENPSLQAATAALQSDIGTGDKVLVTGVPSADGRSVPARSVYLMTKADIAQKSAKDMEQWRTRGMNGKVISVDGAGNTVTVQVSTLTGGTSVIVTPKAKAKFLRYAPDSVRFDEARESSISEIKAGDMFRAVGDKSADGTHFDAEEVLTGAFQTIAGTIKSVEADKKEILIKDLRTGKDITIVITDNSILKRFPTEMAERMASFQAGGGARPPGGGGVRPSDGASPGQGGGRGPRANGIDDLFERLPPVTASELKPGDMIAISSSKGGNVDRIKAIKLLAGVEPFLRIAQATGGQRGQQGVQGGLNIPGLDGFSFP